MLEALISKFTLFRQTLHQSFQKRADASFELVDALSSNTQATTVVELSLNERYRRNYCSLTRSIGEFYPDNTCEAVQRKNQQVTAILSAQCPLSQERTFHLFAVDATSIERLFSPTLEDRSPVYTPRPAMAGNKPITIGHQYSVVVYLPEKLSMQAPPWVIPLSSERINTKQNSPLSGMKQITSVTQSRDEFLAKLCVSVADSAYSSPECLKEASQNDYQIHISRVRNNRVLNRLASKKRKKSKRGRPRQYGKKFKLRDKRCWGKAAHTLEFEMDNQKNKTQVIKLECWENILMRNKYKLEPFRLVRIRVFKPDGERLFKRSLWLLVAGKRRHELTLKDIFLCYRQRFDIEHFFRFGKTRLLMDKFQTPEVVHEEAWWQFVMMSYTQLYLGRQIAITTPNPWEKYLPEFKMPREVKSPTQVQKDFDRIIRGIGTPARSPKCRNKSTGRQRGDIQIKRPRHKVIYKDKKRQLQDTG